MVMPLAGRVVAAVAGGLLVLVAVSSVTVTLIVSRPVKSRLTRWVDRMVDWAYEQVAARVGDYRRRDQVRATQAAAVLLARYFIFYDMEGRLTFLRGFNNSTQLLAIQRARAANDVRMLNHIYGIN